jgi:hypothetical protein
LQAAVYGQRIGKPVKQRQILKKPNTGLKKCVVFFFVFQGGDHSLERISEKFNQKINNSLKA